MMMMTFTTNIPQMLAYIYIPYIWVNYNNSLTWIKAIWGWFPILTIIPVRSQWGRDQVYPDTWILWVNGGTIQELIFHGTIPSRHPRRHRFRSGSDSWLWAPPSWTTSRGRWNPGPWPWRWRPPCWSWRWTFLGEWLWFYRENIWENTGSSRKNGALGMLSLRTILNNDAV